MGQLAVDVRDTWFWDGRCGCSHYSLCPPGSWRGLIRRPQAVDGRQAAVFQGSRSGVPR